MVDPNSNLLAGESLAGQSISGESIPGGWTHRSVAVAGRSFDLLLPARPDDFLEHLATLPRDQQESTDIYWAQLWNSAEPLARLILEGSWPAGIRGIELGCGIGLPGLAAAAKGIETTLTDYVPQAVRLAVENARRNGLVVRGEVLDWFDPPEEEYDFIFASDIIYDLKTHEPLCRLIQRMLAPGGVCWFGDSGRYRAGAFLETAASHGLAFTLDDGLGKSLAAPRAGAFQRIILRRKG